LQIKTGSGFNKALKDPPTFTETSTSILRKDEDQDASRKEVSHNNIICVRQRMNVDEYFCVIPQLMFNVHTPLIELKVQ
jgi:hypothetical protein